MTSKREEIEARLRDAVREGGGWPNDAALERYIARAVDETIAALAVFEQAHTPTDDERELLAEADALVASWDLKGSWTSESPVGLVMRLAAALRRPVQGEPPTDPYFDDGMIDPDICRECEEPESSCRCVEARTPEPQSEPADARFAGIAGEVTAEAARSIAKHGEQQHLPMGTGADTTPLAARPVEVGSIHEPGLWPGMRARQLARIATLDTKSHSANEGGDDSCTWWHILREEVFEAAAESDPAALRAELVQVAAVAVKMIDALDAAVTEQGENR